MKLEQSVPKRRYIKFRRRRFTQKKAYNKHSSVGWTVYRFDAEDFMAKLDEFYQYTRRCIGPSVSKEYKDGYADSG